MVAEVRRDCTRWSDVEMHMRDDGERNVYAGRTRRRALLDMLIVITRQKLEQFLFQSNTDCH